MISAEAAPSRYGHHAAQDATPFVDQLLRQSRLPRTSFHMPGHKQRSARSPQLARLWGDAVFQADLSEIGGAIDYLHQPQGALRCAQHLAAEAMGADYTFFLVNGSTGGNQAALLSCVRAGQKVLVPRVSHRSVFAALLLCDAVPVYIPPLYHPDAALPLAVDTAQMEILLRQHPDVAAIHITSPSYYGFTSDVAACARLAHRYGVPLLVDEAHGAHFAFHPDLPRSALASGADLAVQSTHKTLGSLTQSSMLHGMQRLVPRRSVEQALAMLQSSSPSALLLASLDAVRATMATEGHELLEQTLCLAESARRRICRLPGLWCYGADLAGRGGVYAHDPTKLLIRVGDAGLTGFEAANQLKARWRVEVELSDSDHILCSLTINDTEEDVATLLNSLETLVCETHDRYPCRDTPRVLQWPAIPQQAVSLREAAFARSRACALREAEGKICGEAVIPYPPGIPALLPGEKIEAEMVAFLETLSADGATLYGAVVGPAGGVTVQVLKE